MEQQTFDAAGMIAEVAKRANQQPIPERYPQAPAQAAIPYWFVRRRPTGGTWTTNTDWRAQFDTTEATFYDAYMPAGSGWIMYETQGEATLFEVMFESDSTFSETVFVDRSGGTGSIVQVQCNGFTSATVNELTASGTLTINVREGRNTLMVMCNDVDLVFCFSCSFLLNSGIRFIQHDPHNRLL